jgi:hypothetical protein
MAKRKNKRKKTSSGGGLLARLALPEGLMSLPPAGRWLGPATWTGFAIALVVGWIVGVPRLEHSVAASARSDVATVEFIDLPVWVEGDLLAMLETTAVAHVSGDPLDRSDLARVREALLDTAWFDDIRQVRRTRADRLVVDAAFVRPFAVIRDETGDHLVDRTGTLLPMSYPVNADDAARASVRRFVITGVHFDRPARPGRSWEGDDVTASLRLLRLIDTRPWFSQVAALDAGRYLADGTLVIVTDIGARITWGSAPGEEPPGEVPSEGKIAYLDTAWEQFERIDRGHDGELYFLHKGYIAR